MKRSKKNLTNYKISLIMNIIIFIFTVFASITMFAGIKFMNGKDLPLELTKLEMFKFFTVDSNLFMGIIALIFLVEDIKVLKHKKEEIDIKVYILKLMSTSAVGLTFFVVFLYLGPFSKYGILSMIMNSNLFFHLLTPVLSMITFVLFEKTDKLKFKHVFYGLIPMAMYACFYILNVFTHIENGKVSIDYDWYWFIQNGIWTIVIVVPIIFTLTFLISFGLWKINEN